MATHCDSPVSGSTCIKFDTDPFRERRTTMNRLIFVTALSLIIILVGGCATKSDYVLPEEARKLTAEEITKAYTDARGEYHSIDDPGLTAILIWKSDAAG